MGLAEQALKVSSLRTHVKESETLSNRDGQARWSAPQKNENENETNKQTNKQTNNKNTTFNSPEPGADRVYVWTH